ncbi:MAG: IPT/TIG domain-containing protein, partial [Planctomycetota bacterium]
MKLPIGGRSEGSREGRSLGWVISAALAAVLLLPGCGVVVTNVALFFALSTEEDEIQEIPVITGVYPPTGPVEGGSQVTVYGYLFKPGCEVLFDGSHATEIVVLDAGSLSCKVPPMGSNRRAAVTVRNTDGFAGTTANAYSYWWDADWLRRWTFQITGSSAGVLADYQVRIIVPYDGEMKTDFSDLRFTQLEGGTETPVP